MAEITGSQGVFVTEVEVEDSPGASVVVISGPAVAVLFLGLVAAVVVTLLRIRRKPHELSAKEILDRRLAAGEITPDHYRELRALMDPPREPPTAPEGIAGSD